MPPEPPPPPPPTTSAASATIATTTVAATTARTPSRPIPPIPPYPHPHYHSPQQQAPFTFRAPTPPLSRSHGQSSKPFLYPFGGGGGGGLFSQAVRPFALADHVARCPPPAPAFVYSHGVRAMAGTHSDYINTGLHSTMPPPRQPYPHLAQAPVRAPAARKGDVANKKGGVANKKGGVANKKGGVANKKGAPRFPVSDGNGYKDISTREKSRDDNIHIVNNRRVKITEDASLYALCRSWLKNGIDEEIQPQQRDLVPPLPIPPPARVPRPSYVSNMKEDEEDEHDGDEKSVDHLSPQDLLKKHVERAKRVKARLKAERLQRIARHINRIKLLLPSLDDADAGN